MQTKDLRGRPRKPAHPDPLRERRSSYTLYGLESLMANAKQDAVAEATGINAGHLSRLRRRLSGASWQTVQLLAGELGVTPDEVVGSAEKILA